MSQTQPSLPLTPPRSKLARALAYLENHEGLGFTVVIVAALGAITGVICSIVFATFAINQTQCSTMCAVAGDVGKETSDGCVCASPDGERWTQPPTIEVHQH